MICDLKAQRLPWKLRPVKMGEAPVENAEGSRKAYLALGMVLMKWAINSYGAFTRNLRILIS